MKLNFTNEILSFLDFAARESVIAQIIIDGGKEYIKQEGDFISMSDEESISYLPISKFDKTQEPWKEFRTKIKVGRFIRKFFTEFALVSFSIQDSHIERFVNLYKSYFSRDTTKLRIVEGSELRKYYLEENYHSPGRYTCGSLWNSCMRQKERNKFLKLYEENPDMVKMLVYTTEDGKIRARALLWQEVNEHDSERTYKVMDRIYYVYDHDVEFFKHWATQNGYITKLQQNAKSEAYFDINGPKRLMLYINLANHKFQYAPYLDTFKFYSVRRGRFSNSEDYNYDYVLVQSNGDYERVPEEIENTFDED